MIVFNLHAYYACFILCDVVGAIEIQLDRNRDLLTVLGILELLPLHFQCFWQLHQNKASNAMALHCLVLALLPRHPHLERGISENSRSFNGWSTR